MSPDSPDGNLSKRPILALVGVAAFVVVMGGLKAAAPLVVPFLLAAFLAILCAPPMLWLERKGLPRALALVGVFLGVFGIASLIAYIVKGPANQFGRELSGLEVSLEEKINVALASLGEKFFHETKPTEHLIDFGQVFEWVRYLFSGLGAALGKTFLIFLSVLFILAEISSFPLKFRAVFPSTRESLAMRRFTESIRNYIAIKTATSLVTGILITVWLTLSDVQFPILWGLLAFLLNFIPNVGSILAALPPTLLAWINNGVDTMLLTALAFFVVNMLIGGYLEPRVMGRGLGISPLVVFVSLVFWGWILGPIGMFLSVPLTMTIKIALESNNDTRWIAVLLGSESDAREALERQGA